jgi:putative endonuclease
MTSRRSLGDFGERVAKAHLEAHGYRVLASGVRLPEGQIDLIAVRDSVAAFVEVKTRRGDAMGSAAETIRAGQAGRLLQAADQYAQDHPELPADRRIDLIAIDLDRQGRVVSIEHIEAVVQGD